MQKAVGAHHGPDAFRLFSCSTNVVEHSISFTVGMKANQCIFLSLARVRTLQSELNMTLC